MKRSAITLRAAVGSLLCAALGWLSTGCHTAVFGNQKYEMGIWNQTDAAIIKGAVNSPQIKWSFSAVRSLSRRDCAWSFSELPPSLTVTWKTPKGSYNGRLDLATLLPNPKAGRIWIIIGPDNTLSLKQ